MSNFCNILPATVPKTPRRLPERVLTASQAVVTASERKLLRGVELFDVYEGKNLPAGKKSYAIAITIQDDERTLQDKQRRPWLRWLFPCLCE